MRRKFAGSITLLLVVAMFGLESSEGGWRARARRASCPPKPICCLKIGCIQATIECPHTLTGTTSSNGVTYYTYSGDECDCSAKTPPCTNVNSTSISYTAMVSPDPPNFDCTQFHCVGRTWTGQSNAATNNCIVTPGSFLKDGSLPKDGSSTHVGHTGIVDYADNTTTFTPAKDFAVKTNPKFPFVKGNVERNAVVFVVYADNGRKPLHAVGFELDEDALNGTGAPTSKPDSNGAPYLYETSIPAKNGITGKIETIQLRIHTKTGT